MAATTAKRPTEAWEIREGDLIGGVPVTAAYYEDDRYVVEIESAGMTIRFYPNDIVCFTPASL